MSETAGSKPSELIEYRVTLWPKHGATHNMYLEAPDAFTVQILGGTFQMLGNVVYQHFSLNLPFAAAVALIPVIIMMIYLGGIRKSGALDNL